VTATVVNGLAVVKDEPQVAPFRDRAGSPIYQPQTRVLTLSDGSVVYGCVHCDYSSPNVHSVRPHLNKHRKATETGKRNGSALNLPLTELMRRLDKLDALAQECEDWKSRALRAERRLKQLRSALGVTE
jgi:hypothetical protein